ncbi:MAG TPA: ABC transporter ATP-binding protein [Candidatus Aminicenantes bacterium]|nr:ABC transporter ATP-binding protein [Candidatus Aminicenantes bacterium]
MSGTSRGAAVGIEDLVFGYEKDRPILRGLSLEIEAGERFGILGPSGAGKSTLLLHLNGLLRGEGRVRIGDEPVGPATLASVRRRVGLVFEDPDDQLFTPTIGEDVAFGPLNLGLGREEAGRRVRDVLERVGLAGFERRNPHRLSLGERKRAALATVLSMAPEVVAFDEPFSNLHPALVERLMGLIAGLDATVILVSQQILPALAVCDRIAVLLDGRIARTGTPAEIAADRALLSAAGLDIRSTLEAARRRGVDLGPE